jgi:hypothetical protein
MEPLAVGEAVGGGALLFFLPGFVVAKALFPERRVRGPEGLTWAVELAALALVLSVVLTVTVGYVLLVGAPGGFSATWGDPVLEAALVAIAVVALVAGWLQGAYARVPPVRRTVPVEPGGGGAWELSERLDRLQREQLTIERQLRRTPAGEQATAVELRARLGHLREEAEGLRAAREAEYDL